jgi:hypothetical protein
MQSIAEFLREDTAEKPNLTRICEDLQRIISM